MPTKRQTEELANPRVRAAVVGAFAGNGRISNVSDDSPDVRELEVSLQPESGVDLLHLVRKDPSPAVRAAALAHTFLSPKDVASIDLVLDTLHSDDPFMQAAAREVFRRHPSTIADIDAFRLSDVREQLGVLLAQRAAGISAATKYLPKSLESPDERVRFVATQWIGEARLKQHREALLAALNRPGQSAEMFGATLTSLALVDGAKNDAADGGGRVYLERILDDAKTPFSLKARALRRLPPESKAISFERLSEWIRSPDAVLRLEAVRALTRLPDGRGKNELANLAERHAQAVAENG